MSLDTATARAAVKAANLAGKQVTLTTTNGETYTGTARMPTADGAVLAMFGVAVSTQPSPSTVMLDATRITSINTAATAADTTLGTIKGSVAGRVTDPAWHHGAGLD